MSTHNEDKKHQSENPAFLTRTQLIKLRQKAQRHGTWHKTLNTIERSLINLAITTVNKIRSTTLAKSLIIIVKKLLDTTKNKALQRQIQTIGLPQARKLSKIAQNWGNKTAAKWATDTQYATYLTICIPSTP